MPAEGVIREEGFLVKLGEAFGAQEWMWKSWKGIILAIIILLPAAQAALDFWVPKAVYASQQFFDYYQHFQFPPPDNHQWIAFTDGALPPAGVQVPLSGLSAGTGVYPVSGQAPYA
jgi:hypothetical protein